MQYKYKQINSEKLKLYACIFFNVVISALTILDQSRKPKNHTKVSTKTVMIKNDFLCLKGTKLIGRTSVNWCLPSADEGNRVEIILDCPVAFLYR